MKCDECRWWVKWTHISEEVMENNPGYFKFRGECRINPPVILQENADTVWPDTKDTGFCAKFAPVE